MAVFSVFGIATFLFPFGPDRLRKVIIIILVTVVWFLFIRLLGVWGEVIRWNRVSFTSLNRESAREEKPD